MPIPNKAEVSSYFYDAGVLRALTVTGDGRVVPKVPTEAERRKVNLKYYLDQGFIQRPRDLSNFCPNRKNLVDGTVLYFTTEEYVLTNKYWSAGVQYATTEVTILKYGGVEPLIKVVPPAPLGTMLFDLQNFRDRMNENPTTIPANHYFIVIARGKGVLEFAGVRNQLPHSSPIPECSANVTPQSASPHPVFPAGGADVRVPRPSYSPVSPPSPGLVAPTPAAPPAPQEQVSVAGPSGQFVANPSRTATHLGPATGSATSTNVEQRLSNLERNFAELREMLSRNIRGDYLAFGANERNDKVHMDKFKQAFTPRSEQHFCNDHWD